MKLAPQVTQEIFLRVKENRPHITKRDIEQTAIKNVDPSDSLRIENFEKAIKCQLSTTHMYKMKIFNNLLVYLCIEDGNNPSIVFIVRITNDK